MKKLLAAIIMFMIMDIIVKNVLGVTLTHVQDVVISVGYCWSGTIISKIKG